MPPADRTEVASIVLSAVVALVAAALAYRQWTERRQRSDELSTADSRHFARQDLRRGLGVLVMLALAAGIVLGARIPPAAGKKINDTFLHVWIGISLLVFALLTLAMLDWLANRAYARRQQKALARERIALLQEAALRRSGRRPSWNGHGEPYGETPN